MLASNYSRFSIHVIHPPSRWVRRPGFFHAALAEVLQEAGGDGGELHGRVVRHRRRVPGRRERGKRLQVRSKLLRFTIVGIVGFALQFWLYLCLPGCSKHTLVDVIVFLRNCFNPFFVYLIMFWSLKLALRALPGGRRCGGAGR